MNILNWKNHRGSVNVAHTNISIRIKTVISKLALHILKGTFSFADEPELKSVYDNITKTM